MKRNFFVLLIALSIILSLASCGKQTSEPEPKPPAEAMYSLKTADISMSADFSEILCLDCDDDTVFVFGKLSDNSFGGFTSDINMTAFNGFSFEPSENEAVLSASQLGKEKFALLTYADGHTVIRVFDTSGNETESFECGNVLSDGTPYVRLYASGNGFYINDNNDTVTYIDSSGKNHGEVSLNGKTVLGMVKNGDKQPYIILSGMDNKCSVAVIDGTALSDIRFCGEAPNALLAACTGAGEFSLVGVFYDAMYGLKGNEWIKLTDFIDNDFAAYDVRGMIMNSENSFVFNMNRGGKAVLSRVVKRTAEENAERRVIKMAMLRSDPNINAMIQKYNSSSDKYKVEAVYYKRSSDIEENIQDLKLDMISGKAPDIIPFSASMPVDSFGSPEGIFVDLYTMIDADPELERSDFIGEYLDGLSSKGKLYFIDTDFTIHTVICKEKFLGGLTSWDYEQMKEVYRNKPAGIDFSAMSAYMTPRDAFLDIIRYSEFVDYENASCSFDSDTFIGLLKFFKNNEIGSMNNALGYSSDDIIDAFRTDRIMLDVNEIRCFLHMPQLFGERFNNEPAALIGYPSADGSYSYVEVQKGYSISVDSDNKEGAWDFIKFAFESTDLSKGDMVFPILKKQLDRDIEYTVKELERQHKENADIAVPTAEETERCKKWVIESSGNVVKFDASINSVIYEELSAYFNNGSGNSAEDTAKMIQNRVSLYLSEKYQ